jgi:hypothetical protein
VVQRIPPLGIRLYGENFNSAHAAKVDGEKAVNAPPPLGGGFELRLKAGLVRLWRT